VLFALGPLATVAEGVVWAVGALYLGGALWLGYWIFRHYRGKR
jgi:hypothetical protein